MAHSPGQFWLIPKVLEEQGASFVILATKPEAFLAYPLDVKDWKYKRHISQLTTQVFQLTKHIFARSVCKTTIKLKTLTHCLKIY